MEPTPTTTKFMLDLGCGARPREGYEGVDLYPNPGVEHVVDLFKFPWPWADQSVDGLCSSHFLEHLPAQEVRQVGRYFGKDMLVVFMDEAYRVLKPGCAFEIIVPSGRSDRAFQDPTHRRFFVPASFLYYNRAWRESQGLTHYLGEANFDIDVNLSLAPGFVDAKREEMKYIVDHVWNATVDLHVKLTSLRGV